MMSLYAIDEKRAKENAIGFLQQHYSVIKIEEAILKGEVWSVSVLVSVPHDRRINVKISAKTGNILGWT